MTAPNTPAATAALGLRSVSVALPGRTLIRNLTLTVAAGEIVTLMGPSGVGKSSLLAWIGGFLAAPFTASGDVTIGTASLAALPPHERAVGILFQDDLLFPHLSVAGNLLFGLPADVRGAGQRRREVERALADADLAGFAERDPATLSGGQRARVALLRTLLARPRALLLDEPFGKLDAALREDFRDFVFARARALGLPTLLVTHDERDAQAAGGRVVELAS
ncbi:MAG: ATP-binding cassette domain-containing protein [Caldimonas sp.]